MYTDPQGDCVSNLPAKMQEQTSTSLKKLTLGRVVLGMRPSHPVRVTGQSEQGEVE